MPLVPESLSSSTGAVFDSSVMIAIKQAFKNKRALLES
jgi:hypothetical protein